MLGKPVWKCASLENCVLQPLSLIAKVEKLGQSFAGPNEQILTAIFNFSISNTTYLSDALWNIIAI